MAQRKKATESVPSWKEMLVGDTDFLTEIVRSALQDVLEAEMDETLQAAKSERTPQRLGYRSGYYARSLVTRVGFTGAPVWSRTGTPPRLSTSFRCTRWSTRPTPRCVRRATR